MLAGRNDVEFVTRFASNMANFSDDGISFHGAYGYRWRHHFKTDQLENICAQLRENPLDRRVVLQMWDPRVDGNCRDGKDFPCNLTITFSVNPGSKALDMTVFNRSNDIVWGAYGANAVHMSMLQEYVATATGWPVGSYYQISTNWHAYADTFHKVANTLGSDSGRNPYDNVKRYPLMTTPPELWMQDLMMFMYEGPVLGLRDPFFRRVANPMHHAWEHYKNTKGEDRYDGAMEIMRQCAADDWRVACQLWIQRRKAAWLKKTTAEE
jgi:hypothetical protein